MANFIDTPVDATITEYVSYETLREMYDKANTDVARLTEQVSQITRNYEYWSEKARNYERLIGNAVGVIQDYYSENGEITDELRDIAKYLEANLTKRISGTASFEISWSAQVPLDFDPDDFEISFAAECESYDAEDFEYQIEDSNINAEEDY